MTIVSTWYMFTGCLLICCCATWETLNQSLQVINTTAVCQDHKKLKITCNIHFTVWATKPLCFNQRLQIIWRTHTTQFYCATAENSKGRNAFSFYFCGVRHLTHSFHIIIIKPKHCSKQFIKVSHVGWWK